jgi:hypothetical protein
MTSVFQEPIQSSRASAIGGGAFRGLHNDLLINYAFSRANKGKKIVRPITASGRLCNFGTLC